MLEEDRKFFQPNFFAYTSPKFLVSNLSLVLATIPAIKRLLATRRLLSKALSLSVVAVNARKEMIGFYYLIYWSTLGGFIRRDYQNLGLGSRLGNEVIALARKEKIPEIYAYVVCANARAIHVNQKRGFKVVRVIKGETYWKGKYYDCVLMARRL